MGTLSLIFMPTNAFQFYLSLSECWCLFCLFTPSEFFVFHRKKLILLNLINWYVTSASQWFVNSKYTVELCKFLISANYSLNVIQTVGVNIFLYWVCHSIGPCVWCVSFFVCMISNQSTSKKPRHMLDLSKMTRCCIKHTTSSLWHKAQHV